jgi:Sap, sulfolipid-1-addressing protein
MAQVFLLSLTAALNPTLIAVTTVMLLLPNPVRLMLGYLTGAFVMSITCGVLIVYSLKHSGVVSTTQHSLSPAADIALGTLALVLAFVLATGRYRRVAEIRRTRSREKGAPRWQRAVGKGSARIMFVVGALLTLPGASYVAALVRLAKLDYSTSVTVLIMVLFNVVMLALLEVPLLCFAVAPDWTPRALARAKAWVARHWLRVAVLGLSIIGGLLILKGVLELVA